MLVKRSRSSERLVKDRVCETCGVLFRPRTKARFCRAHQNPAHRTTLQDLAARFWSLVDKDGPSSQHCPEIGPCWIWTGRIGPTGYGLAKMVPGLDRAHRLSWFFVYGEKPSNHVLHRCDVRACVRPDHLFLGSHLDNARDRDRKGRNGNAKLTDLQVREIIRRRMQGETTVALGQEFGIHPSQISHIMHGNGWNQIHRL